ncbi:modular serine protease isoform X1 [Acyrthosiphon pisum]|uniref:Peptidase S1 domain-containing protein n=1 Tax=Acyrthosiphon pisum TaxID=7029 RepID=A0A8R2H999_ACYPI|nr:modular serine protease isoform X1 [Acyrthosiphon pisum]|eukprot:XP_016661100.1 PREDICTED: proclotting enzyme isoform X1 [Acyrthosiphon pisum]
MKSAYTFILAIYSYFVFETVILCDRDIRKRQTEPTCTEESEYACQSGQCIDVATTCDGIQDCSDGSDETQVLCESTTCPTYGFKCTYGACINIEGRCDGVTQCLDGSDEELCSSSITSEPEVNLENISTESTTTESTTTESTTTASTTTPWKTTPWKTTANPTTPWKTTASTTTAWKTTSSPTTPWKTTAWKTTAPTTTSTPDTKIKQTESINQSSIQKKTCVIPDIEGTKYFYKDTIQNVPLSHGSIVNNYRIVEEDCEEGYYKTVPYKLMVCSEFGQWKSVDSDKLCLKKCTPMVSDVLDIKCSLNGVNVNCSKPSEPGTILTQSCKVKNSHNSPREQGLIKADNELLCLKNAKWNGQLLTTCTSRTESTSNRLKESSVIAPWNVEIYKINNYGRYFRVCGGTLIAPNLVVSAAHCFWKKGLRRKILQNENNVFKTAVGKENSNFSTIDNTYTQIIDISLIHLEDSYDGLSGHYADDISVIVLASNVVVSNGVRPASIDWSATHMLSNGDLGKMFGLGMNDMIGNGQHKSILKLYTLPYIDRKTCQEMYTDGFENYVTKDKFCTGYKLVTGERNLIGFGGSGLIYEYSTGPFLTGIFSVKDLHSKNSIAVFTSIKYHVEWIRNIYGNYVY